MGNMRKIQYTKTVFSQGNIFINYPLPIYPEFEDHIKAKMKKEISGSFTVLEGVGLDVGMKDISFFPKKHSNVAHTTTLCYFPETEPFVSKEEAKTENKKEKNGSLMGKLKQRWAKGATRSKR